MTAAQSAGLTGTTLPRYRKHWSHERMFPLVSSQDLRTFQARARVLPARLRGCSRRERVSQPGIEDGQDAPHDHAMQVRHRHAAPTEP